MSPPPLSLSAPELGYNFFPIRPLRNSVSSTELLHEQAMNRFYQVVALKEAEKVKAKKDYISLPASIEIKIHSMEDEENKMKRYSDNTLNQTIGEDKRDNLTTEPYDREYLSNESLNKDKNEETGSNFGDDYTASTVSTGDSDFSDSDSLDEDVDGLRHRIEENATYHPSKETTYRGGSQSSQAVEVLTKPARLPDPNFIPKPILKKRDPVARSSPHKDPLSLEKAAKYPEPLKKKVPLFKKFAKFPLEKHGFNDKKKNNKKDEKKLDKSIEKPIAQPIQEKQVKQELELAQDEGRTVAEHYGNLVKEYGNNKKPQQQLYTNTNELKKAAANQNNANAKASNVTNNKQAPAKTVIKRNVVPQKRVPQKAVTSPKASAPKKEDTKQQMKTSDPQTLPVPAEHPAHIETVSVSKSFSELNAEAESNVKSVINYIIDVFMLLVAFWLYLFKDERLALPFLGLTMYRQVNSAVRKKIPSLFTKKHPTD